MRNYKLILFLLSFAVLSACDSNDDELVIFEEAADVRMESTLAGYKDQMTTAEDGWKVRYFPDSSATGGWNFLMRFDAKNNVQMIGDVYPDPELQTGFYELLRSQGPVLNFGSYLPITELVNPSSLHPQSRYGSNDFIFVDEDFTDDIKLISKRNRSPFVLQRATSQDWEDILLHAQTESEFSGGGESSSVFRFFTASDGTNTTVSEISYDPYLRFLNLRSIGEEKTQISDHGLAFTKDSVIFNPPLEYGGEQVRRMAYLPETQEFYGENSGVEVRLYYNDGPLEEDDDYLIPYSDTESLTLINSSTYYRDSRDMYSTNPYWELYDQVEQNLNNENWRIASVQLYYNYAPVGNPSRYRVTFSVRSLEDNASFFVRFFVDLENKDNKMYFTDLNDGSVSSSRVAHLGKELFQPLIDFYTDPEGLYVDRPGDFFTGAPGFTFVSASDPSIRVFMYD